MIARQRGPGYGGKPMKHSAIFLLLAAMILVTVATGCASTQIQLPGQSPAAEPEATEIAPNPNLSPREVVQIQVEALQHNDPADTGIEITFRFASPENRQFTGPLAHFKRLVKNPVYRPMLNHKLAEYEPIVIAGDTATQRVTIVQPNGQATVYLFSLSKQHSSSCDGCWMTDSVSVVPTKKQNLNQI